VIFRRRRTVAAEIGELRAALGKVLAFATSAGDTITIAEALEVIRGIAREALRPRGGRR